MKDKWDKRVYIDLYAGLDTAKMKEYGLVDSGDTLEKGVGAMTDERVKNFYAAMVKAGVEPSGLDYKKAFTLEFVDKGVGLELHPK